MPASPIFEMLAPQYRELWAAMEIRASKAADIEATAQKIIAKKTRYQAAETATRVPWFMIGAIHAMECGLAFDRHLHCGDPLTARTYHVPKGRPLAPPADGNRYTWAESAIDALTMKGLETIGQWPIERICYELERYNGWGYRWYHGSVLSPYLWSGTNHYARGKYVADGQWSSTAVSGQSGAMALVKRLSEHDPEVAAALAGAPVVGSATVEETIADPALVFPKADAKPVSIMATAYGSRTIWAQIMAVLSVFLGYLTDLAKTGWDWVMWAVGIVPDVYNEAKESLTSAQEMAGWVGINLKTISIGLACVCIAIAIWRHLNDKRALLTQQQTSAEQPKP